MMLLLKKFGRVYKSCEKFRGRVAFFGFHLFFVNKFCENFEGKVYFHSPPPPPLLCDLFLREGTRNFKVKNGKGLERSKIMCVKQRFLEKK
jgi:hypothetical protein